MQIFSTKLSKALDVLAVINTKLFLGGLFIFMISVYGIIFKILQIDLLRLKKKDSTYWLNIEIVDENGVFKQY